MMVRTLRGDLVLRADELGRWLAENEARCLSEQAHLDADTRERAYWHYGYLIAIKDVLAMLGDHEHVC